MESDLAADARRRDGEDPLASYQTLFAPTADGVRYLDGNSLGRLPRSTIRAVTHAVEHEWQTGLVRSWNRWIDLPLAIGNELAPLIGAPPDSVLITDQTSLNIYKIGTALLRKSGRSNIVTDSTNFPSDLYVLSGIAAAAGGELRVIEADPLIGCEPDELSAALDDTVGLVELSHITFKTGAVAPMAALTNVAHSAGAAILWDLAHSAGVFPVDVAAHGIDAAIGCTYKHLNAGPGAPGFLYVRPDLIPQLRQPIQGWWGHADPFAFAGEYRPVGDIRRFGVGTQPILSMVGVREGVRLSARAGIAAIRHKSITLTDFVIQFFDASLAKIGFTLATPRDPTLRGAHVAINHPEAYQISQALIAANVVADFRAPDTLRIGIAPLANSYIEVYGALETLREIVSTESYLGYPVRRSGVS